MKKTLLTFLILALAVTVQAGALSGYPLATTFSNQDLVPVSSKQPSGSYVTANMTPAQLAADGNYSTVYGLLSSFDDNWQKSFNSPFAPPDSVNWLSTWKPTISTCEIWVQLDDLTEYAFAYGAGANPSANNNITGYMLAVPIGTTNVLISFYAKQSPDANGSSLQIGLEDNNQNLYNYRTVSTTASYQLFTITNINVNPTFGTNVGLFLGGGGNLNGCTISNLTVTYSPSPTNPVIAGGYVRYATMNKNFDSENYHTELSPSQQSPFLTLPSGNSGCDFITDASQMTLEVADSGDHFATVTIDAGQPNETNILISSTGANPIYKLYFFNLPANQWNTVHFNNGQSENSAVTWLRAIWVPQTNGVIFKKQNSDFKVMAFGDSIIQGTISSNSWTTPFNIMQHYAGIQVRQMSDGSSYLWSGNLSEDVAQVQRYQPNVLIDEHAVNEYNNNITTNVFYIVLASFVDQVHLACPGTYVVLSPFPPTASESTANGIGLLPQAYRNIVNAVAARPSCASFCTSYDANASGWFSSPAPNGFHQVQAANVKMAYWYLSGLETWAVLGQTNQVPNLTTNISLSGGATLHITNSMVTGYY